MKTKFNQSKLKLAIVSAIMACSAGLSATSHAATASDNMAVSTLVANSCTISAGDMQFATYDTTSGDAQTGTAIIATTCTLGGAMVLTLGEGASPSLSSSDTVPVRQMIGAGGNLLYDLYTDLAHTTVWGNTAGTGRAFTATGGTDNITVYGLIPEEQPVGEGSFADSVAVTLTY